VWIFRIQEIRGSKEVGIFEIATRDIQAFAKAINKFLSPVEAAPLDYTFPRKRAIEGKLFIIIKMT